MQKRNSQKQITQAYHSKIKGMLKGQVEKEIFDALAAGKNNYLRYDRLQSSSFDSSWIEMIEGVIFDLGDIIANPKMTTRVDGNIVPVELARKTGAESVQHLSSHTQYIKEIDEYGNVIPSKIMTMVNEDDIKTYENRFIATLVRRLVLFIEKRYEVVAEFAELRNQEVLMFKNKSIVNGAEVEIETKVRIAYKSDDKEALKSSAYIERIKQIRTYVLYFYNSSFMRQLKNERDVRNPILQTNIIRKNPKYHHCYEVYRFIETYDKLGVNYKVDENYSLFSDEEINELNHTLFANFVTLRGKDISKNHKEIKHVYKPRIETSIDDEKFIYGPLMKGPFSFVRADDKYHEYLDSKINKELPLHPTKHEKLYYYYDYEEKRGIREDQKQIEDLIKRRNKEVNQFEKDVQKILEEREKARLALLKQEQELIKQEEDARLKAARDEIIAASLRDQQLAEEEAARKEKEFLESIKPAEVPVPMSHPFTKPVTYDEAVAEIWPQSQHEDTHVYDTKEPVVTHIDFGAEYIKPAVVPVPMSHPSSDPVTYEEAVEQIWPQINNVPSKEEAVLEAQSKEEPVAQPEEQPQAQPVDNKPQVVVVPMSHPTSDPVTYDEAVAQIWPQSVHNNVHHFDKGTPVVTKVDNVPSEKVEDQPVEQAQPVETKPAVVPTPLSHPASEPVTYDEAVAEIWPQSQHNNVHVYDKGMPKVVKVEAPVSNNEQAQPSEIKPAVVPTPMSHPVSEPVTYDEAVAEIWPQSVHNNVHIFDNGQPAVKEEPVKKTVRKSKKAVSSEQPVEQPKEIKPAVVPTPMSHPHSDPVTYEQAVEQIWPQSKHNNVHIFDNGQPTIVKVDNSSKEEIVEAPVKEAPKAQKAPAKKATSKAEEVKEKPVEAKKAPVPQPVVEDKPVEAPVKENQKPVNKAPVLAKKPVLNNKNNKQAAKPVAKPAPVVKPAPKKEEAREKIPGKFVVKTHQGYYVNKNEYSIYKNDAKVFDDFNLANDLKKALGGKVVKL